MTTMYVLFTCGAPRAVELERGVCVALFELLELELERVEPDLGPELERAVCVALFELLELELELFD